MAAIAVTPLAAHAGGEDGGRTAPAPPPGYALPPGYAPPPGYAQPVMDKRELKRILRRWEPGDPIPPGFHAEERPRLGLVISGSIIFGLLWFGSVVGGTVAKDTGVRPVMVPVVGPFIAAGTARDAQRDDLVRLLYVTDGVIQVGGAAMLIAGILATRPQLVRDEARANILPMPMRIGDAQGFGVVGRF